MYPIDLFVDDSSMHMFNIIDWLSRNKKKNVSASIKSGCLVYNKM